jgi:DNA-binding response OmpR family regulator
LVQNSAKNVDRPKSATASVLIVDDDQAVREGLAAILEGAGYSVLVADTFERGRDVLRTTEPDLLIVDVRLGDFNGLQLLATSVSPLRAIVLTGYADSALERDARQMGAEYLVKPVTRAQLLDLVASRLHAAAPPPR